jgi:hypothetical protein
MFYTRVGGLTGIWRFVVPGLEWISRYALRASLWPTAVRCPRSCGGSRRGAKAPLYLEAVRALRE